MFRDKQENLICLRILIIQVAGTVEINEIKHLREHMTNTPMSLENTFQIIHFDTVTAKTYTLKQAAQQQRKARYKPCPEVFCVEV